MFFNLKEMFHGSTSRREFVATTATLAGVTAAITAGIRPARAEGADILPPHGYMRADIADALIQGSRVEDGDTMAQYARLAAKINDYQGANSNLMVDRWTGEHTLGADQLYMVLSDNKGTVPNVNGLTSGYTPIDGFSSGDKAGTNAAIVWGSTGHEVKMPSDGMAVPLSMGVIIRSEQSHLDVEAQLAQIANMHPGDDEPAVNARINAATNYFNETLRKADPNAASEVGQSGKLTGKEGVYIYYGNLKTIQGIQSSGVVAAESIQGFRHEPADLEAPRYGFTKFVVPHGSTFSIEAEGGVAFKLYDIMAPKAYLPNIQAAMNERLAMRSRNIQAARGGTVMRRSA